MKVPDLLAMIRDELNRPDVNLSAVQRALPLPVSYDSLLRVKSSSPHSPSWAVVHALAELLVGDSRQSVKLRASFAKPAPRPKKVPAVKRKRAAA